MNKQDFNEFKNDMGRRVKKVRVWINDNRETVVVVAPIVIGGAIKISQLALRRHNIHLETRNKELFVYDRSLGHYWELRRKLSNNEWLAIETRRKSGENLAQILSSLRVLK